MNILNTISPDLIFIWIIFAIFFLVAERTIYGLKGWKALIADLGAFLWFIIIPVAVVFFILIVFFKPYFEKEDDKSDTIC